MSADASLEILIKIRDELAGLTRARAGLRDVNTEAQGIGTLFRQGLGIGSGMVIATSAIALLKNALVDSARRALDFADEIKNGSEELGITAEAYQVLRLEMLRAGADMGRLSQAFTQQVESMAMARDIASSAATAYRTLGLDVAALERMPFDQRLVAIATATAKATDKSEALSAAAQILGSRRLPQLLNALRDVSKDGLDRMSEAAKAAGQVMDRDTAERLNRAKETWQSVKNWVVVQSAGLIDALLNPLSNTPAALIEAAAKRAAADAEAAKSGGTPSPRLPLSHTTEWRQKELALTRAQTAADLAQGETLFTEKQRREALISTLRKQLSIEAELLALARATPLTASENQFDREKAIVDREARIAKLQQQILSHQLRDVGGMAVRDERMRTRNSPDNPDFLTVQQGAIAGAKDYLIGLGSTGQIVAQTLQGTLGAAVSSISNDLWEAQKGTQSWGDTWRNLGDLAGRALTEVITKLVVIRTIESALGFLGLFGKSPGTVTGGISSGSSTPPTFLKGASAFGMPSGKFAGGGTFVTQGPMSMTVGDNPGGMELVSVKPLSGVGRTTVSPSSALRGGGGQLLSLPRGAAPVQVVQHFHVSAGVSSQVRAELLGMMPTMRELAVDSVREAIARNKLHV